MSPPDQIERIPPHATGGTVDLTLVDENGKELDMGTEFDFFGPETAPWNFLTSHRMLGSTKKPVLRRAFGTKY